MIKLIVKACLVLNPSMCLPPVEVIPETGDISSITSCMMGGSIYGARIGNADYYVKVFCGQYPDDLSEYLREKVK